MSLFVFPLFAAAAPSALEWLLAFFVLASFVLVCLWTVARQRIGAAVMQEARAEFLHRLLSRFRRGMESRLGPVAANAVEAGAESTDILAYANIAEALCGGYAGIFYVDILTGRFEPFRSDGVHTQLTEYAGKDYFGEEVQKAILAPIHPDDVPALRAAFRRDAILAATAEGRVFTRSYRYVGIPAGEPVWYSIRATRASGGDDHHLVIAVANIDAQMKREKGLEARAEASIAKLEELLGQSAHSRSTLVKLATDQDAEKLRELALRETGEALGAVAAYLYRHNLDGTTPLVLHWALSPQNDTLPENAAQLAGTPDYLDQNGTILYRRGQPEDNNPVWDEMLRRVGATHLLAGLLRVEGEIWGHVGYAVCREGGIDSEEVEQFHEACALVQIGVLRAKILETRDFNQRQLVASARAANQAARAKTMFLATMSHEIRTPLNAVIGYSEFLTRPNLSPGEIREYTAGISRSANALLSLINDILDLSKLDSGIVDMSGRCDLVKLFEEMESLFHYRAVTKELRLSRSIRRDFPVLRLSEEHLRQVLLNVIGNAVKFTDVGIVEWSAQAEEDGPGTVAVDIVVRDTGIGVSKEKLDTIFDPYVQDSSMRGGKVYGGTGLGLPIVKRLLESCGGTIRMESEPGRGTRVLIRIAHVPVLPRKAPPAAGGNESRDRAAPTIATALRALLVDDVPINLKILEIHIRYLGIRDVAKAGSGEEALRLLSEHKPDIVLTDMWMPGMSGADLAAEIRRNSEYNRVPIVAVTADNNVSATFDASLFAEIITKPIAADKLRRTLTRLFPTAR